MEERVHVRIDQFFAILFLLQWGAALAAALWGGSGSSKLLLALLAGGLLACLPISQVYLRPGRSGTRLCIALAQSAFSGLLIFLTEGRLETHFHVFGSLAFLSLYGDARVLILASLVTAADHWLRGWLAPLSIFGVASVTPWRWLEHTGWVAFCDIFLILAMRQARLDRERSAEVLAELEASRWQMEEKVNRRTHQLQLEKERFVSAFENAPIGMALVRSDGRIDRANHQLGLILDCPEPELRGQNLNELLLQPAKWMEGQELELSCRRADGGTAFVLFKASRQPNSSFVVQIVDVSLRRQTEMALRQAQKLESIGQLAGGIAHEINTPIQYISDNLRFLRDSFGELLEDPVDLEFLREEIPKAIDQSLDGAVKVATIVRSIKEYSHQSCEEHEAVDLHRVLENTIEVSRNEWRYHARVDMDFDPEVSTIRGNRNELCQVFLNLVVNAAQAIAEKGQEQGVIRVATRRLERHIEVTISDTGSGIPESIQAKIFNPFFTTKEVGKGTGQGLSICHSVLTRHQATIDFRSQPGEGTQFLIRLPLETIEPSQVKEVA